MGVTYDAGALIGAERNDRRMWALHAGYLAEEVLPTVPANVLAQAWTGGSSRVNLARMLRPCSIESMDEDRARRGHIGSPRSGRPRCRRGSVAPSRDRLIPSVLDRRQAGRVTMRP